MDIISARCILGVSQNRWYGFLEEGDVESNLLMHITANGVVDMSNRALVAYENTNGSFDLYYSHNGARDYLLYPVLQEYVSGNINRDAMGAPRFIPSELKQVMRQANTESGKFKIGTDGKLIDPDPLDIGLSLEEVEKHIEYGNIETLYIVRDGAVETYLTLSGNVRSLYDLAVSAKIQIFEKRKNETVMDLFGDDGFTRDARWVFEGDNFSPAGLRSYPDEAIDILTHNHDYLLTSLRQAQKEEQKQVEQGEDINGAQGAIDIQGYVLQVTGKTDTIPPTNPGILVRVPWVDGDPIFPWVDGYDSSGIVPSPRRVVNHARFEASKDLWNRANLDECDELANVDWSVDEYKKPLVNCSCIFFVHLQDELNDYISTELMPEYSTELMNMARDIYDSGSSSAQ